MFPPGLTQPLQVRRCLLLLTRLAELASRHAAIDCGLDVCTVVLQRDPGAPSRILAVRDEFVSREFDDPDAWWPEHPSYIGGRDQQGGGTWCATDVRSGRSAVVLNRRERQTGKPSRGVLPLAALNHGADWPQWIDLRQTASFTLVLDTPRGATAWTWDSSHLTRTDLSDEVHLVTASGIDPEDAKGRRYAPRFTTEANWLSVVRTETVANDLDSLVVRHPVENETYATVFVQSIRASPGDLVIDCTRTPDAPGWTRLAWSADRDGELTTFSPSIANAHRSQ